MFYHSPELLLTFIYHLSPHRDLKYTLQSDSPFYLSYTDSNKCIIKAFAYFEQDRIKKTFGPLTDFQMNWCGDWTGQDTLKMTRSSSVVPHIQLSAMLPYKKQISYPRPPHTIRSERCSIQEKWGFRVVNKFSFISLLIIFCWNRRLWPTERVIGL